MLSRIHYVGFILFSRQLACESQRVAVALPEIHTGHTQAGETNTSPPVYLSIYLSSYRPEVSACLPAGSCSRDLEQLRLIVSAPLPPSPVLSL